MPKRKSNRHLIVCCLVNGRWSEFSNWTPCEVTCGGGRRFRARLCDNPPPSCDGYTCSGHANETERCSDDRCPGKIEKNCICKHM